MTWKVETLNETVDREILDLPADVQGRLIRMIDLIQDQGLAAVGYPYVRHLRKKVWEMRLGAGRALYVAAREERVVIVHVFRKQSQKTPKRVLKLALARAEEVLE